MSFSLGLFATGVLALATGVSALSTRSIPPTVQQGYYLPINDYMRINPTTDGDIGNFIIGYYYYNYNESSKNIQYVGCIGTNTFIGANNRMQYGVALYNNLTGNYVSRAYTSPDYLGTYFYNTVSYVYSDDDETTFYPLTNAFGNVYFSQKLHQTGYFNDYGNDFFKSDFCIVTINNENSLIYGIQLNNPIVNNKFLSVDFYTKPGYEYSDFNEYASFSAGNIYFNYSYSTIENDYSYPSVLQNFCTMNYTKSSFDEIYNRSAGIVILDYETNMGLTYFYDDYIPKYYNNNGVEISPHTIIGNYRFHNQVAINSISNNSNTGTYNGSGMCVVSNYTEFHNFQQNEDYLSILSDYFTITIAGGNEYSNGYSAGFSAGQSNGYTNGYNAGYNAGVNSATQNNNLFFNLFGSIADTPILMLRSLFDFDLFGVNVLTAVLSLLTGIVVVFVIRKFI